MATSVGALLCTPGLCQPRFGRVTQAGPRARSSDRISSVTRRKERSPQKVEVGEVIKVQNQPYVLQH